MAGRYIVMASKDFIYDIMEKLEEEGQEYLLLTPERRRNEVVVDVNYSLVNEDSLIATIAVLEKLAKKLEEGSPEDFDGEDWTIEEE